MAFFDKIHIKGEKYIGKTEINLAEKNIAKKTNSTIQVEELPLLWEIEGLSYQGICSFFIVADAFFLCSLRFVIWRSRDPPLPDLETKEIKKPIQEDKMKKNTRNENNVQNRFTGYLMAAVRNKRMSYMEKKKRVLENEYSCLDMLVSGHTDFEQEYYHYLLEKSAILQGEILEFSDLVKILKEKKLIRAILGLKQRDQDIVLARVFKEQSFEEIGKEHGLSAKQAEMAYYYVIRKIRKELEGRRYE